MPRNLEFLSRLLRRLLHIRRMAALERYGLASMFLTASNKMTIETRWGAPELATMEALQAWRSRDAENRAAGERPQRPARCLLRRMRSYIDTAYKWFIRYDNGMGMRRIRIREQRGLAWLRCSER